MVNSNRELIFSQLLKDDDGVLRELLMSSGLSDIEAAATIDRFIFELRHATESEGVDFEIDGLGTMSRDGGGKLIFTSSVNVEVEVPLAVEETPVVEVVPPAPMPEAANVEEVEVPASPKVTLEEICQKIEQANTKLDNRAVSNSRQRRAKRGVDRVLVLGIVAVVIALAAIAYGFYVSNIELVLGLFAE